METLERITPIIRNVAHPMRLRILDYLDHQGEPRSVSDIMEATGGAQAIVSQQLRILKDQGVLAAKREGNFVLYSITDRASCFSWNVSGIKRKNKLNVDNSTL